jgi:DNA-binding NarL/FixJ family response regulator
MTIKWSEKALYPWFLTRQTWIISTVSDGREAVEAALEHKPDIILMDIGMPELNGIDASRKILSECPQIKIIAISMYASNIAVIEMLRSGAVGYIHKMAITLSITFAKSTLPRRGS